MRGERSKHLLSTFTSFVLWATSHGSEKSLWDYTSCWVAQFHVSRFYLDLVNIISSPCLFKCRGGAGFSLLIVSMFSTLLAGSFHFAHASVDYFFIKV